MNKNYLGYIKTRWFIGISCLVFGAVIILGIRFFTYKTDTVHYHANFALYVNGQQEQFSGMQYYTEAEMCTLDTTMIPTERAHMHDNVNNVVHVEDHTVTWGQFFVNLGWYIGPDFIESPDGTMYKESGDSKLNVIVNGQNYTDLGGVANRVIKDQDKLLLSFGSINDNTLLQAYSSIPNTAQHYDVTKDPESCSGSKSNVTMHNRLVHMF